MLTYWPARVALPNIVCSEPANVPSALASFQTKVDAVPVFGPLPPSRKYWLVSVLKV